MVKLNDFFSFYSPFVKHIEYFANKCIIYKVLYIKVIKAFLISKKMSMNMLVFKKKIIISNDDIFEPIDGRWSCPYCMYHIVNNGIVCSQ